jgi:protein gp37
MSTKIEWARNADGTQGKTWNPIVGCKEESPGCARCYALRMARRQVAMGTRGYSEVVTGDEWNGKSVLVESALEKPMHWRKPQTVFVCSMSDLFAESVREEWIDRVFAVMALTPQHTYILCTKRAKRMYEYVTNRMYTEGVDDLWQAIEDLGGNVDISPPLPNVIGMVTAENQEMADIRIPWLLRTPFVSRWVSGEPLLGPLDIQEVSTAGIGSAAGNKLSDCLHGVIVGGESGPGARPMDPEWVRSVRDQCAEAGVAFNFKGWGEWMPVDEIGFDWERESHKKLFVAFDAKTQTWTEQSSYMAATCAGGEILMRVGKQRAGRILDGRTHDDCPEVAI